MARVDSNWFKFAVGAIDFCLRNMARKIKIDNPAARSAPKSLREIDAHTTGQALLACRGLDKWYAGVHALRAVDLDVYRGEVIGLVGDNGAGKSTLINILSGAHPPDAGTITVDGQPVRIDSTRAIDMGIETIYQHTAMVATLSIARNIFLGRELRVFASAHWRLDRRHAQVRPKKRFSVTPCAGG